MSRTPIHIIYASTSGNVELVVDTVAEQLKSVGHDFQLHRAEQTEINVLTDNNLFILATSTWEHGEINPFFAKLLAAMSDQDFKGKRAGFIGLGDKRYEPVLFCAGIDKLQQAFLRAGGEQLGETMKINGEPHELLDSEVKDWALKFIELTS